MKPKYMILLTILLVVLLSKLAFTQLVGPGTGGATSTGTGGGTADPNTVLATGNLTGSEPLIGQGGKNTATGSRTGNTTIFSTWTGVKTANKQVTVDASGNLIVSASDVGSGGGTFATDAAARAGIETNTYMSPALTAAAIQEQSTAMIGRTIEIAVAKCQKGSASSGFNIPSANDPQPFCDTDGKPTLVFQTSDTTSPDSFIMPAVATTITATAMMRVGAASTTASGNAMFRLAYVCTLVDGTAVSVPAHTNTVDVTATLTATAGNLAYPVSFVVPPAGCGGKRLHWVLILVSKTLATDPQLIDTFYFRVQ